jgi:mannose-1-phosphate guanylyltransferase
VVIGEHVGIDTHSCLIHGEQGRLIATIGLDNLVIVDTEDALLLLPVGRSQEIKDLLEQIKAQKKEKYL